MNRYRRMSDDELQKAVEVEEELAMKGVTDPVWIDKWGDRRSFPGEASAEAWCRLIRQGPRRRQEVLNALIEHEDACLVFGDYWMEVNNRYEKKGWLTYDQTFPQWALSDDLRTLREEGKIEKVLDFYYPKET